MSFKDIKPVWRMADDFSKLEAAALMAGHEPSTVRMEGSRFWFESENGQTDSEGATEVQANLRALINAVEAGRLYATPNGMMISREDLVAWLDSKGYRPEFFFPDDSNNVSQYADREAIRRLRDSESKREELQREVERLNALLQETTAKTSRATHWPWGDHHTELLEHLEAAARRFWVNYDPHDNTTAPTNADVSEWLKKERSLSKTMADAIASILRADGLPTGPRK